MDTFKEQFFLLSNCEKINIISNTLREKLNEIASSNTIVGELNNLAIALLNDLDNNLYNFPDEECYCIDLQFYFKLIEETIGGKISEKVFKEKIQFWERAIASDSILDNLPRNEVKFNITGKPNLIGQKFYFDFNIYQYIENNDLTSKINDFKLNIIYSPIHLEEVYRMTSEMYQNKRINSLTELTKNNIVLNIDNALEFYIEEPKYSMQRVNANIGINKHVENNRVVKFKDKDIFFSAIQDDKFKYITEKEDLFEQIDKVDFKQLLSFAGCFLEENEFKKQSKTFDELLHMIYSLYDVLDNIAFSIDKPKNDNRTLKSSIYDIEHLIYASACDVLITSDKKFYKRACQIYKFMNINTIVFYFNNNEPNDVFFEILNNNN